MDTRTYKVTDRQVEGLAALLKAHGLTIDPSKPSGEQTSGGWDVSWSFGAPEDGSAPLTINLVKHPFLAGSAFWSKIDNVLKPS